MQAYKQFREFQLHASKVCSKENCLFVSTEYLLHVLLDMCMYKMNFYMDVLYFLKEACSFERDIIICFSLKKKTLDLTPMSMEKKVGRIELISLLMP